MYDVNFLTLMVISWLYRSMSLFVGNTYYISKEKERHISSFLSNASEGKSYCTCSFSVSLKSFLKSDGPC